MSVSRLASECFALCCAVMLGLAAGAIWLLPEVFLHRPLPWLAIPAGWMLASGIRQWVHEHAWLGAVLALIATLVASAYVRVLMAAVDISTMMGYGLIDAMRTAGISMLLDIARISSNRLDKAWALAGAAIAVIKVLRAPREASKPSR